MPSQRAAAFTEKYPGTFRGPALVPEDGFCGIVDLF